MPTIALYTFINAPVEVCYNLSLSVDLHLLSAHQTQERIIAGVKSGILTLGDTVTWQAKHFGLWQKLTVKITETSPPFYFVDEMLEGPFESMKHRHFFESTTTGTIMRDEFCFASPFGIAGRIFNALYLEKYMKCFLIERNQVIKEVAESDRYIHFV